MRLALIHAIWPTSFAILSVSGGEQKGNPRWISIQTDRSLQMTNTPFCLFPQGHPLAKTLSGFDTEGCRGVSLLSGRHPRLQCAWISSGTAPEREARTNDCVPFVQYPIYDRSCHTSQSAHCNLCGNDQTSTHAVLKWSGVAAALVNPLYLDISRTTMPHRLSV